MTPEQGAALARNASASVNKNDYPAFIECVWNEGDKCLNYKFTSDADAEKFLLARQVVANQFRFDKKIHHNRLIVVREYRG
jgi:hypothetical protein